MHDTYEFFQDNGSPLIKEWGDAEKTFTRFSVFIVTFLEDIHPVDGLLLGLDRFLNRHRDNLGRQAR